MKVKSWVGHSRRRNDLDEGTDTQHYKIQPRRWLKWKDDWSLRQHRGVLSHGN